MMSTLLRNGILATAERDVVERFVRDSRWSRALVARFVAGDRLEDALGGRDEVGRARLDDDAGSAGGKRPYSG